MIDRRSWLAIVLAVILTGGGASGPGGEEGVVFANESPYDTMDPHAAFDVGRVAVRLNLYDGLYRWLDNPPKLEPWLAESHTVSADGLTYTFKLRRGRQVPRRRRDHRRGRRYSAERILALKKGAASLLSTMIAPGSTKALDRPHRRVHAHQAGGDLPGRRARGPRRECGALKKHEKDGDWGAAWLTSNEAGSAPTSSRATIRPSASSPTASPSTSCRGAKCIDEIEFRTVKEDNTRVLGLIKGDYQGTGGYLPNDQVKRLREART